MIAIPRLLGPKTTESSSGTPAGRPHLRKMSAAHSEKSSLKTRAKGVKHHLSGKEIFGKCPETGDFMGCSWLMFLLYWFETTIITEQKRSIEMIIVDLGKSLYNSSNTQLFNMSHTPNASPSRSFFNLNQKNCFFPQPEKQKRKRKKKAYIRILLSQPTPCFFLPFGFHHPGEIASGSKKSRPPPILFRLYPPVPKTTFKSLGSQ